MTSDSRLQELVDYTKRKIGLDAYHLYSSDIHLEQTLLGSMPILSMEWFPNGIEDRSEEGLNPPGTAVVDLDINSGRLRRVIFTGGKTFANLITLNQNDMKEIIRWVEQETGLTYDEHFSLQKQNDSKIVFQASYDGIPTSPSGHIDVELDDAGRLTLFAIHGEFPERTLIRAENYTLTADREIERLAYEQLKLIQFPLIEQKKWQAVYALEEIYISNDKHTLIPFTLDARDDIKIDQVMKWDTPIDEKFEGQPLFFQRESLTLEQALSLPNHTKPSSLSEREQALIIEKVMGLLRQEFPKDSGKWLLKRIFHDEPYIIAELGQSSEDNRVHQRKLSVYLEAQSYEVVNYMNKDVFLKMFENYAMPDKVTITKETAFDQLKDKIELTPAYVYDFAQKMFILCGKLDCQYGVMADSGDVVALSDL